MCKFIVRDQNKQVLSVLLQMKGSAFLSFHLNLHDLVLNNGAAARDQRHNWQEILEFFPVLYIGLQAVDCLRIHI